MPKSLMHLVINRGIIVTAAQILLLVTFCVTSGHLYWCVVLPYVQCHFIHTLEQARRPYEHHQTLRQHFLLVLPLLPDVIVIALS
jgi:hypothetical protein